MKMKKANFLWIITIVNSVVLIIIILVFIASLTYPAQSTENEIREWVTDELKKERTWVSEQLDLNIKHVEKASYNEEK